MENRKRMGIIDLDNILRPTNPFFVGVRSITIGPKFWDLLKDDDDAEHEEHFSNKEIEKEFLDIKKLFKLSNDSILLCQYRGINVFLNRSLQDYRCYIDFEFDLDGCTKRV